MWDTRGERRVRPPARWLRRPTPSAPDQSIQQESQPRCGHSSAAERLHLRAELKDDLERVRASIAVKRATATLALDGRGPARSCVPVGAAPRGPAKTAPVVRRKATDHGLNRLCRSHPKNQSTASPFRWPLSREVDMPRKRLTAEQIITTPREVDVRQSAGTSFPGL
jgi:hypothetical protein